MTHDRNRICIHFASIYMKYLPVSPAEELQLSYLERLNLHVYRRQTSGTTTKSGISKGLYDFGTWKKNKRNLYYLYRPHDLGVLCKTPGTHTPSIPLWTVFFEGQ